MNIIISRNLRIISKSFNLPKKCNYKEYLPESFYEKCDCKYFCKFPPKTKLFICINNNLNLNINLYK